MPVTKRQARKKVIDILSLRRRQMEILRAPSSDRRVQTRSMTNRTIQGSEQSEPGATSQPRTNQESDPGIGETPINPSGDQPPPHEQSDPGTGETPVNPSGDQPPPHEQSDPGTGETPVNPSGDQPPPHEQSDPGTGETPVNPSGDQPPPHEQSDPGTGETPVNPSGDQPPPHEQSDPGTGETPVNSSGDQPPPHEQSNPVTGEASGNRNGETEPTGSSSEPDEGEASESPIGEAENELCQTIIDWDNGQKRIRLTHKISMCFPNDTVRKNEDDEDEGLEECSDDWEDEIPLSEMLRFRKRKREVVAQDDKGENVKKSRGPSKPRDSVTRQSRPSLKVVGDGEFEATPKCSKIHSTIRMLLFKHVPIPVRSYNGFSPHVRLIILKQFLKIYKWESGQNRRRCIDVYENIAADVYRNALGQLRRQYTKKIGESPSLWKAHPPQWCLNKVWVWEGLCKLYETDGWQQLRKTNCANKAKDGGVAHHVAGPRSSYQVEQQLIKENPNGVSSKDVFDKMHKKVMPDGTAVYVNARLADMAKTYDFLKALPEAEGIKDEALWTEASGVKPRKGIFGFGFRSITQESPLNLMGSTAGPATKARDESDAGCESLERERQQESRERERQQESRERERQKEIDAKFAEIERKHKEEMSEMLARFEKLESLYNSAIQNSNKKD